MSMDMSQESISWGELAELTHATQVERFNFCICEEQEQFPYDDCPRNWRTITIQVDEEWFSKLGEMSKNQDGFIWCKVEDGEWNDGA